MFIGISQNICDHVDTAKGKRNARVFTSTKKFAILAGGQIIRSKILDLLRQLAMSHLISLDGLHRWNAMFSNFRHKIRGRRPHWPMK